MVIRRAFALVFILIIMGCTPNEEKSRPNVILILADDLGYNQLGCYGGAYDTPNLDKFSRESLRFTQAYSSAAVCSPTRAALMTGKYPARLNLTDFIKGEDFPDSLLQQPDWQKYLPLEEKTIAEVFRDQGYRTAIFGKWHLSHEKRPPESHKYNPDKQGFDEFMVTYKPVRSETDPENDPHNVDSITSRSIQFISENKKNPFLLVVSHNAIHDPVMESDSLIRYYRNDPTLTAYDVIPEIAAMVHRLDRGTGRLLDHLKNEGLEKETIVMFYSDNGGKAEYASMKPFRKGKGWLYEGGIRVPMLVRWPGRISPGSSSDRITSTIDLFPTLYELALKEPLELQVDGASWADHALTGAAEDDPIQYWHYPHYHRGSGMRPASAIRSGNYKLIEWHQKLLTGEPAWELYDLENDPGESKNLSQSQPEVRETLKQELDRWKNEVQAQMPVIKHQNQ